MLQKSTLLLMLSISLLSLPTTMAWVHRRHCSSAYVWRSRKVTQLGATLDDHDITLISKKHRPSIVIAIGSLLYGMCANLFVPFSSGHGIIPVRPVAAVEAVASATDDGSATKLRPAGKTSIDGEASRIFMKARQTESDGEFKESQKFYEEVLGVEPDYIYAWSNLGNVLVAQGNLDQALLCYKKAISLKPPKDTMSVIILNKAAIELSTGDDAAALKDLDLAEALSGPQPSILTNKAVALSLSGKWSGSVALFEKVISSAERNALPWWLRYSMALLETSRGTEAVAYLQRVLKSFPQESECKAFASALYTALGSRSQAEYYWNELSPEDRSLYATPGFVEDKLHWGERSTKNFHDFLKRSASI